MIKIENKREKTKAFLASGVSRESLDNFKCLKFMLLT